MADHSKLRDPFREARRRDGILQCPFQGETLPMILRHADVREAAKDWKTFSSDAPFRVPIPSEEEVRTTRQLPIETNPPEHTEYRAIVEPFFQRAKQPEVIAKVEAIIREMLSQALERNTIEIVREFALPVQSRALTCLLNVPESEAQVWIGWGIHVFKVTGGEFKKGIVLEDYLRAQFDRAEADPGEDFFSALATATYRGRKLTRDEMMAGMATAGKTCAIPMHVRSRPKPNSTTSPRLIRTPRNNHRFVKNIEPSPIRRMVFCLMQESRPLLPYLCRAEKQ